MPFVATSCNISEWPHCHSPLACFEGLGEERQGVPGRSSLRMKASFVWLAVGDLKGGFVPLGALSPYVMGWDGGMS